jgi:2-amino-4-hydroxy-6-hydroxymethyldihydropteridine diphosphokinase
MLREAVSAIEKLPDCHLVDQSRWHETAPVGGPGGQGAFLNGAVLLETQLAPHRLCESLLEIEAKLGRQRAVRWDARAIDIDILLYGNEVITSTQLAVPHPRMSFRRFVLEPAAEIAAAMVHPTSGWTIEGLLTHLRSASRYVAVTAADPAIAEWLASQLATKMNCPRLEQTLPNRASQGASAEVGAVESIEVAADLLKLAHWQSVPMLSECMPGGENVDLPCKPVVSGFWEEWLARISEADASTLDCLVGENAVKPALVIAVEMRAEEDFPKKFPKDIPRNFFPKRYVSPSLSPQEFGELLCQSSIGPLARIQSEDPTVVIQEAMAAVDSAWQV